MSVATEYLYKIGALESNDVASATTPLAPLLDTLLLDLTYHALLFSLPPSLPPFLGVCGH